MKTVRKVIVFDAADLHAESTFWTAVLDGHVIAEDTWHSVVDAAGEWLIGVQLAVDHVAPQWPGGSQQQQVHVDLPDIPSAWAGGTRRASSSRPT